ncbi:hypothetical protein H696_04753 [Fonticula alba]|uniref:Uncharacterized protein n=1 Tax=Fonticula alba TaxID=691883 RepID=A0A058Z2I4_FONAL|nr:hypothetical protein H696_04753 [Fonticula alba]KCV68459.1 hypothetical protein H696_04753 [Fonticula alba]|eukprot:XP_009496891.1 hypothetical protein H696_04753 [Fonticula alba]
MQPSVFRDLGVESNDTPRAGPRSLPELVTLVRLYSDAEHDLPSRSTASLQVDIQSLTRIESELQALIGCLPRTAPEDLSQARLLLDEIQTCILIREQFTNSSDLDLASVLSNVAEPSSPGVPADEGIPDSTGASPAPRDRAPSAGRPAPAASAAATAALIDNMASSYTRDLDMVVAIDDQLGISTASQKGIGDHAAAARLAPAIAARTRRMSIREEPGHEGPGRSRSASTIGSVGSESQLLPSFSAALVNPDPTLGRSPDALAVDGSASTMTSVQALASADAPESWQCASLDDRALRAALSAAEPIYRRVLRSISAQLCGARVTRAPASGSPVQRAFSWAGAASRRHTLGSPTALAVAPGWIAIGTAHGFVIIFDFQQQQRWLLGGGMDTPGTHSRGSSGATSPSYGPVTALALHAPRGPATDPSAIAPRCASGYRSGHVIIWDLVTGKSVRTIQPLSTPPAGATVTNATQGNARPGWTGESGSPASTPGPSIPPGYVADAGPSPSASSQSSLSSGLSAINVFGRSRTASQASRLSASPSSGSVAEDDAAAASELSASPSSRLRAFSSFPFDFRPSQPASPSGPGGPVALSPAVTHLQFVPFSSEQHSLDEGNDILVTDASGKCAVHTISRLVAVWTVSTQHIATGPLLVAAALGFGQTGVVSQAPMHPLWGIASQMCLLAFCSANGVTILALKPNAQVIFKAPLPPLDRSLCDDSLKTHNLVSCRWRDEPSLPPALVINWGRLLLVVEAQFPQAHSASSSVLSSPGSSGPVVGQPLAFAISAARMCERIGLGAWWISSTMIGVMDIEERLILRQYIPFPRHAGNEEDHLDIDDVDDPIISHILANSDGGVILPRASQVARVQLEYSGACSLARGSLLFSLRPGHAAHMSPSEPPGTPNSLLIDYQPVITTFRGALHLLIGDLTLASEGADSSPSSPEFDSGSPATGSRVDLSMMTLTPLDWRSRVQSLLRRTRVFDALTLVLALHAGRVRALGLPRYDQLPPVGQAPVTPLSVSQALQRLVSQELRDLLVAFTNLSLDRARVDRRLQAPAAQPEREARIRFILTVAVGTALSAWDAADPRAAGPVPGGSPAAGDASRHLAFSDGGLEASHLGAAFVLGDLRQLFFAIADSDDPDGHVEYQQMAGSGTSREWAVRWRAAFWDAVEAALLDGRLRGWMVPDAFTAFSQHLVRSQSISRLEPALLALSAPLAIRIDPQETLKLSKQYLLDNALARLCAIDLLADVVAPARWMMLRGGVSTMPSVWKRLANAWTQFLAMRMRRLGKLQSAAAPEDGDPAGGGGAVVRPAIGEHLQFPDAQFAHLTSSEGALFFYLSNILTGCEAPSGTPIKFNPFFSDATPDPRVDLYHWLLGGPLDADEIASCGPCPASTISNISRMPAPRLRALLLSDPRSMLGVLSLAMADPVMDPSMQHTGSSPQIPIFFSLQQNRPMSSEADSPPGIISTPSGQALSQPPVSPSASGTVANGTLNRIFLLELVLSLVLSTTQQQAHSFEDLLRDPAGGQSVAAGGDVTSFGFEQACLSKPPFLPSHACSVLIFAARMIARFPEDLEQLPNAASLMSRIILGLASNPPWSRSHPRGGDAPRENGSPEADGSGVLASFTDRHSALKALLSSSSAFPADVRHVLTSAPALNRYAAASMWRLSSRAATIAKSWAYTVHSWANDPAGLDAEELALALNVAAMETDGSLGLLKESFFASVHSLLATSQPIAVAVATRDLLLHSLNEACSTPLMVSFLIQLHREQDRARLRSLSHTRSEPILHSAYGPLGAQASEIILMLTSERGALAQSQHQIVETVLHAITTCLRDATLPEKTLFGFLSHLLEESRLTTPPREHSVVGQTFHQLLAKLAPVQYASLQMMYFELMCICEPGNVCGWLKRNSTIPLEHALAITNKNGIAEASAYLLSVSGDLPGAIRVYSRATESLAVMIARTLESMVAPEAGPLVVHESLPRAEAAMRKLENLALSAIALCQRASIASRSVTVSTVDMYPVGSGGAWESAQLDSGSANAPPPPAPGQTTDPLVETVWLALMNFVISARCIISACRLSNAEFVASAPPATERAWHDCIARCDQLIRQIARSCAAHSSAGLLLLSLRTVTALDDAGATAAPVSGGGGFASGQGIGVLSAAALPHPGSQPSGPMALFFTLAEGHPELGRAALTRSIESASRLAYRSALAASLDKLSRDAQVLRCVQGIYEDEKVTSQRTIAKLRARGSLIVQPEAGSGGPEAGAAAMSSSSSSSSPPPPPPASHPAIGEAWVRERRRDNLSTLLSEIRRDSFLKGAIISAGFYSDDEDHDSD